GYKYWNTSSKSKSLSVEIAGYYVLTQLEMYNHYGVQKSWPVVNWIVRQRNSNGGFVSTQDTIVALQALAKYSALESQISANMNIVLKSNELVSEIKLDEYNRLVVHTSKILILPAVVQLQAIGKGCALVQFSVRYNVKAVTENEAFEISINVFHEENSFCTRPRIHICVRYMNNNETSNMVVVAVKMVSGFLPRETSLDELKSDPSIQLKGYDVEGNLVNLYFNELTDICKCFSFGIKQAYQVKNVQPATVKVYDYYQPELEVTKNYSIPSSCLSDVRESTHESHALSSFETSFSGKTGRLDCPICTYSFPDNFKDVFCTSDFVLKVTVTSKEGNVVEILQDMSYEQHPQPFKMFAEITRDDNCPCRQLNRNGSTLIIAGTSLRLWNSEQDKFHIHLTRQVRVILSSHQGIKREILKQLRSSCDSDSRFPTN
ncbi:alpha-2-macroglobulin-like protein 1, partial [Stegodyphus dumicola]|uniref:alpha-2-macroglobulin-like protein 1 n=1 Tax=Stegodyphus dumicola TaxID=202533 RepID=UPI0015B050B0